ncbi:MAG: GWxTD domain-containing protein [Salinibacter sp.]
MAYQNGRYETARVLLRKVFLQTPARVHEKWGAVAFWLGKTYKACGRTDSMRWAWRRGVKALEDANRFDAPLYDAHLWAQWNGPADRKDAVATYLSLLRRAGPNLDTRAYPVLRRHVAQLLPLLTDRQEKRIRRKVSDQASRLRFRAGAGKWLVSWWRRQDPLPVTATNERVEEHLRRVRHAADHFSAEADVSGFDDRGDLYVRYGPPTNTHVIPFMDLGFLGDVVRFGVGVTPSDFPKNVIWNYPQVGEQGSYLFVKKDNAYRLGKAMDLFPPELKRNYNAADRSQNRAYSSLAAMRYIYEHLAMHYRDPGNVYPELVRYFNKQDHLRTMFQGTEIGEGPGSKEVHRTMGVPAPNDIANRTLRTAELKERRFVQRRRRKMPRSNSEVATAESPLPVRARPIRFLRDDGSTRVEVLWGGLAGTRKETGPQRLTASLVAYDANYERRNMKITRHRLRPRQGKTPALQSQVLSTTVKDEPYHLAMQWERYELRGQGANVRLGDRTGRRTIWFDSLRTLQASRDKLEMSDLRPMVPSGQRFEVPNPTEEAIPYPFSFLSVDTPLLLYFEVYHLAYTAQDRTRYKVAYELKRKNEGGKILGLFGGSETERTETASTYTGTQRRATKAIRVDWKGASGNTPQSVTITVRVTDKTSGQTVERSIDFQVTSKKDQ